MPIFNYQALNAERRLVSGEVTADNLAHALAQLEAEGLEVHSLAARSDTELVTTRELPDDGMEQHEIERVLLRVLARGHELLPPLRAYADELPAGKRRRLIERLIVPLAQGEVQISLAAIKSLPGYWLPLLAAASASHDPGRILREFLRESQQADENRKQWRMTLAYPALLVSLALVLLVGFSYLVAPTFRDMFRDFGLRLPQLTAFVLTLADWVTTGRILIDVAIVVIVCVALILATRFLPQSIRHWAEYQFLSLTRRSHSVALLSRFSADLLEAELAPSHALRLAGLATGHPPLQRAAARVAAGMERSSPLVSPSDSRLLSRTVLYAVCSQHPRDTRIRLLREIDACHAELVQRQLSWARGLIEPLAICLIGAVVGGLALALFAPLISITYGLSF